ncbi:hypothetical protein BDZ45DRAFT_734919 [Acephala macrosclerotiorum]|nr:hypothetical protein BDZ45DRAFT_734919 [Acephala macrosclerotiorum]
MDTAANTPSVDESNPASLKAFNNLQIAANICHLVQLPLEILDQIYTYALSSPAGYIGIGESTISQVLRSNTRTCHNASKYFPTIRDISCPKQTVIARHVSSFRCYASASRLQKNVRTYSGRITSAVSTLKYELLMLVGWVQKGSLKSVEPKIFDNAPLPYIMDYISEQPEEYQEYLSWLKEGGDSLSCREVSEAFGGELWVNEELCYKDRKTVRMPFEINIVYFPNEEDHEGKEVELSEDHGLYE